MKLNIGYFADGPWSHFAFQKLIKDPDIYVGFICVRFKTKDQVLKNFCFKYNIAYLKTKDINSKDFIKKIAKYKCNLFVSMSFNQIFNKEVFNLPDLKTINCHAGKLPFYRGRSILNWAIINDEKDFGITVHYVDEGIDTGGIILQKLYPITDSDDYSTLLKVAHKECAKVLYSAINLIKNQNFIVTKQTDIDSTGFYCRRRKSGDEILDWSQSSREIFNFIRAICKPGPMSSSFINGNEIKINKVKVMKNLFGSNSELGVIIKIDNEGFYVKTSDNVVKVIEYEYDDIIIIGDKLETK